MAEFIPDTQVAASTATPAAGSASIAVDSVTKRLRTKDDAAAIVDYIGIAETETGASRLQNKELDAATTKIVDGTDTTKKIGWQASGATGSTILTIAEAQSTSQTLNVPNIAGASIIITDTLAQAITGVKTMTNPTTAAGTTAIPSMTLTSGTNMTTPTAGVQEFDGAAFYNTVDITNGRRVNDGWSFFKLTANGTGITTIADFFGANSAIPTVLNGVYEIVWDTYMTVSVAATGTATWTLTNTQTTTNMVAKWEGSIAAGITPQGTSMAAGVITQTGAVVALPATAALAIASHFYRITAFIEAATAGNVRLRLTMSAGTATPLRGSNFRVRRLPAGNAGTFVA